MIEPLWRGKKARIALNLIRSHFVRRAKNIEVYKANLGDKRGIEIGGPSSIFQENGILPIYSVLGSLDGCNYSSETIWEGKLREGWRYNYQKDKNPGYQYICEAVDLNPIPQESYDFVLSSHSLEHMANPLKAISEWKRILKDDGLLLLVVPHKDKTFDHNRPVTSLNHLVEDLDNDVGEDDLTHLPEILELHDLRQSPEVGDYASFKKRSKDNYLNRCLHQHVFDTKLVLDLVKYMNLTTIIVDFVSPYHIIVLAKYER
jgi:SAM-dependent methyltransferase